MAIIWFNEYIHQTVINIPFLTMNIKWKKLSQMTDYAPSPKRYQVKFLEGSSRFKRPLKKEH